MNSNIIHIKTAFEVSETIHKLFFSEYIYITPCNDDDNDDDNDGDKDDNDK